jgi:predicted GIY-YIG superfamily endonuclease
MQSRVVVPPPIGKEENDFMVYMLQSHNGVHTYIGKTNEPGRRIDQHNGILSGGANRTRLHRPWEIAALVNRIPTANIALSLEHAVQHRKGRLVKSHIPLKASTRSILLDGTKYMPGPVSAHARASVVQYKNNNGKRPSSELTRPTAPPAKRRQSKSKPLVDPKAIAPRFWSPPVGAGPIGRRLSDILQELVRPKFAVRQYSLHLFPLAVQWAAKLRLDFKRIVPKHVVVHEHTHVEYKKRRGRSTTGKTSSKPKPKSKSKPNSTSKTTTRSRKQPNGRKRVHQREEEEEEEDDDESWDEAEEEEEDDDDDDDNEYSSFDDDDDEDDGSDTEHDEEEQDDDDDDDDEVVIIRPRRSFASSSSFSMPIDLTADDSE